MAQEQTLVLVKPEALQRGIVGELITRFEKKGFLISQCCIVNPTIDQVGAHYVEHLGKPFYRGLEKSMKGDLFAMVLQGPNAINHCRAMLGKTDPLEAAPGTIRGDYATEMPYTIAHASDSKEAAEREIKIWFPSLVNPVMNAIRPQTKWATDFLKFVFGEEHAVKELPAAKYVIGIRNLVYTVPIFETRHDGHVVQMEISPHNVQMTVDGEPCGFDIHDMSKLEWVQLAYKTSVERQTQTPSL